MNKYKKVKKKNISILKQNRKTLAVKLHTINYVTLLNTERF